MGSQTIVKWVLGILTYYGFRKHICLFIGKGSCSTAVVYQKHRANVRLWFTF